MQHPTSNSQARLYVKNVNTSAAFQWRLSARGKVNDKTIRTFIALASTLLRLIGIEHPHTVR